MASKLPLQDCAAWNKMGGTRLSLACSLQLSFPFASPFFVVLQSFGSAWASHLPLTQQDERNACMPISLQTLVPSFSCNIVTSEIASSVAAAALSLSTDMTTVLLLGFFVCSFSIHQFCCLGSIPAVVECISFVQDAQQCGWAIPAI